MIRTNLKNGKYKVEIPHSVKKTNFSFNEEKDKFLFNRGKTVGFRKDKKLEKFVGIRDGYSKQLEFTIKSIKIDENELIPNNRVNFNGVSIENDMILHEMNSTKIFNQVTDSNYRNLIKVDNVFNKFEVIYKVNLKGIKINNVKEGNKYYPNKDYQFIFVDDGNNEVLFIIDIPIAIDANNEHHKFIKHQLYIDNNELYYKKVVDYDVSKYVFPLLIDTNVILYNDLNLSSEGMGVIKSYSDMGDIDDAWEEIFNGDGTVTIVHTSQIATESESVGIYINTSGGTNDSYINRTFLNYDTSIFSGYTEVLSSAKLKLFSYSLADADISLWSGNQSGILNPNDWTMFDDFIETKEIVDGDITEFDIPYSYINLNDFSRFVLREAEFDIGDSLPPEPSGNMSRFTGIDFSRTTLEIIFEPVKVYGQTQTNVIKGDYFYLEAFTNSGTTEDIEWYKEWDGDSGYTGLLGTGSTYVGYSMEFTENNKIYAVKPFTNSPIVYSVPLEVTINVIQLDYDTILREVDYNAIDMDSIYFKYYKCLSGVCYTYVRDLNNIYEGNLLVSDAIGDESYNLYNEFDIIDEFFINSSIKVDVALNENINLNNRFNKIDGVIIRQGTRILLMNQTNEDENGIYVSRHDNKLIKTDDFDTVEKLFRLKIHVKYGSYADKEIHISSVISIP